MPIDATGLTIKTLQEILGEIEQDQRDNIDPNIITEPEEPQGQLNGIFASQAREVWEALQLLNEGFDPDAAEGFQLDNIGVISGILRKKATFSTTPATLNLNAGVTVPAGSVITRSDDPSIRFVLDADVTSTTSGDYLGDFTAETSGPVIANAGTLTEIATPVSGWNTVTNNTDAVLGRLKESDTEYRIRRNLELQKAGSSTVGGILADVLELVGSVAVQVYENTTGLVDANGLNPHSIEVVVYDGSASGTNLSDDEIAQAIWDSRAAGIGTNGNDSGNATDTEGLLRTMKFSRPVQKPVYIHFNLEVHPNTYPGDTVFAQSVVEYETNHQQQQPGTDVYEAFFKAAGMSALGVINVRDCFLSFSPSPVSSADLGIGIRDIADIDTSRITVST